MKSSQSKPQKHQPTDPLAQAEEYVYAALTEEAIFKRLSTSRFGLTDIEAKKRLTQYGYNEPKKEPELHIIFHFLSQFFSPLVLILIIIAIFSFYFNQPISAALVMLMAVSSVILSFIQEYRAGQDAKRLLEMVRITTKVIRNRQSIEIPTREVVPGDIVELSAGAMVPADLRLIEDNDLYINESALTGESFPVSKTVKPIEGEDHTVTNLTNLVFMGSSVISGTGLGVVIQAGSHTQFGKITQELAKVNSTTGFDRGIKQYTLFMIKMIFYLAIFIFFAVIFSQHNSWQNALVFALAVAVGLAPEMLPMLVAVNLSKGAINMSKKEVIIKRLNSIQNFGAMDVLCTDKTGTLTLDKIVLMKHCNAEGEEDEDVLRHAYFNSYYQTGLNNVLDKAILAHEHLLVKEFSKVTEIPFDFERRVMSVIVDMGKHHRLITKGAPEEIFHRCTKYEIDGKAKPLYQKNLQSISKYYDTFSKDGFRVLAIAYRDESKKKNRYSKEDEEDLIFKGFVAFLDPPKPTVIEAIKDLNHLGIELKILSGDNELVTAKVCREVGLHFSGLVTGAQIENISEDILRRLVRKTTVFARMNPMQKERVIAALQDNNHVVGFLGDGINDAPALKGADVGISVDNAVDIAKETADIILLQKNLDVLADCVKEGRKTFGNIVKYIKMGASSNFGNMFSMTGASIILPFLPMTSVQILFNNFLYDLSQFTIPTDNVDGDYLLKPRPWDIKFIKKFLLIIGPLSSVFDFATYAVMWFVFGARDPSHAALFQTGWFMESLITQTLIIYVIRTAKIPFIESKPSQPLLYSTLAIVAIALITPFTAFGQHALGFVRPPLLFFAILTGFVITYLLLVQFVKNWFIKKYGYE